ncbi:MAG TPA: hypothetical protein VIO64_22735 [Pseudobacteroides sp.]|uniref:hypothetical protein n=1 Tax=Pseudobacteroides sp. TaxID=1968840 RepID=UPI002F94F62E
MTYKHSNYSYFKLLAASAATLFFLFAISSCSNTSKTSSPKPASDTGFGLTTKEEFIDKRNHSIEHNGITLCVEETLSDTIKTSIQVSVKGDNVSGKNISFEDVYLTNSKPEGCQPLKIPIISKGEHRCVFDFYDVKPNSKEEIFTLKVGKISHIEGPWVITFPVETAPYEMVYSLQKEYWFGKNKVIIDSIKSTISQTQIEIQDHFESKEKMTRVNMFYLTINGKKYYADNFSDHLDKGETAVTNHKRYVVNFNTGGKIFDLSGDVLLELEYGIAETKVVHKIKIN